MPAETELAQIEALQTQRVNVLMNNITEFVDRVPPNLDNQVRHLVTVLIEGGVQEHNKRAGAENLIGIIGMGVAAEAARRDMKVRLDHLERLKGKLLAELPRYIDEYIVNTPSAASLPNLASVSVQHIEGESVMLMLDDDNIAVATRSACATGSLRASHVLLSIGRSHADAQGTLVITLGMDNTEADIDHFLQSLQKVVKTLRDISPLYQKKLKAG